MEEDKKTPLRWFIIVISIYVFGNLVSAVISYFVITLSYKYSIYYGPVLVPILFTITFISGIVVGFKGRLFSDGNKYYPWILFISIVSAAWWIFVIYKYIKVVSQ